MATTKFRRQRRRLKSKGTSLSKVEVFDYSRGFNSYLANDALPLDQLRLAQDSRISTLGRMVTRKGANFYSDPEGEAANDDQATVTGAADESISTTNWLAARITTTAAGRLTKVELNLKSNTGNSPIIVEIYDEDTGEPGNKLATSSIKSSDLSGSYAYVPARFVDAPELANATNYWIVAYQQEEGTGSYDWSSTTAATTSLSSSNSGGTWASTSYDLNFKTYTSTDSKTKGLYRAYKSDGTAKTLIASDDTLSSVSDVDGSLTAVNSSLNASATDYNFATVEDIIYYVNGVDAPRKWDFTTDAVWGGSGFPASPSLIVSHQDLLFTNDTSDPTKIVFSNEDSYVTADSTNFIYVPSPKSPEGIVAFTTLNGVLHIFTQAGKHSLYGVDKSTFTLVESPARKGTFSQKSVVSTRNSIYFLSDDGVYLFNGVEDQLISVDITDQIEAMTNKSSATLAVHGNRLKLYYRSTGVARNDSCLVYNLDYGTWESEDTNQYVERAIQWSGGADDFEYVTGSSHVGQAFKWGESSNNYSDLGKPLNFEIRTGYYFGKDPNSLKVWKRWYPRLKKQSRTYNIQASVDSDFRDAPSSQNLSVGASGVTWGGGAEWGDGSVYGSTTFDSDRIHVAGQSYYRQYRISKTGVNTPVEFLGHSVHIKQKRVR